MKHPRIEFKLNKEAEKETLRYFLDAKIGTGDDNFEILVQVYPELKKLRELSKEEQDKLINDFVESKYKEFSKELKQDLKLAKKVWKKLEKPVFKEVEKLFEEELPDEVYTAFITIFSRFRYDKDKKFFFVPRNNSMHNINCVTLHESLHFIFFNYWDKNFKNKLPEEKLWDLSEILNVLLMERQPLLAFANQGSKPYPNHEKHYQPLKELFNKRNSMKDFIEQAIKYFEGV